MHTLPLYTVVSLVESDHIEVVTDSDYCIEIDDSDYPPIAE